jgi:Family of unknown function (DUF6152)
MSSKQRMLSAGVLACIVSFGIGGTAAAHHSTAMFADKTIELTGTVKEFQYTNPHSWLLVDVTGDDGTVQTWGFEAEGPSTLIRAGIPKSALPPGTTVTVTARPMKDGRPAGSWVRLVTEDGRVLDPRPDQGN